ncbi:unnamed protein product [Amoebophrya sp. A25]|nr:unnamed protein product [Amoebophrya sp. A25]|eukprot:GSA25T00014344001.1
MGGGSGGRGGRGTGGGGMDRGERDWLKKKRQQQQQRDVESKTQREIDFFWGLQEGNKRYDKERGGAPRKGWKRLEEEEKELFEEKAGMAAGIDFEHYNEITVDINGKGIDDIPICESYDQVNAEFRLATWLADNIWRCHYVKPTPVQKYAIPTGLKNFDMMVCAQTGSGKTAAFLIPIAMSMREKDGCEYGRETWQGPACPLSLVLAPTRELCSQIFDEARKLFHKSYFKVSQCYGGAEVKPQLKDLARGCDVLVATPGRLIDFIDRELVSMEYIQFLTLDEADRMLDMGFEPQIRQIVEQREMPGRDNRQTLMFSATFPREIQQLASSFLKRDYIWISVGRVGAAADTVEQRFIPIYPDRGRMDGDKLGPLYGELDGMELGEKEKVLVFVGMKRTAAWLAGELYRRGRIGCAEIHGDLTQSERERALQNFKTGRTPVLVATEVAARGLDIPRVTKVINFDLPSQVDDYVHRIGRTGRAGNRGTAISLFNTSDCKNNDSDLAPELCQLLDDARESADTKGEEHHWHDVPEWLADEARRSKNRNKWKGGGFGGKRGGSPNHRGARDFRGGGRQIKLGGNRGGGDKGGKGKRPAFGGGDRGGKGGGYGGSKGGDRGYGGGDRGYGNDDRGGFGGARSNGFGAGGKRADDESWFQKRAALSGNGFDNYGGGGGSKGMGKSKGK